MIIVDKPYVSDFLKETIEKNKYNVVKTEIAEAFGFNGNNNIIDEETAISLARSSRNLKIYTPSENSIGWIAKNLAFSELPQKIDQFKNKRKFRDLIKPLYPDYFYKEVQFEELEKLSIDQIPLPFIIKPNVGFFSIGVYKVENAEEWNPTIELIKAEILRNRDIYPKEVMNPGSFIIEQLINGEEYAYDAYYNEDGEPVVLGILKHMFASKNDVSDRVYFTSKKIIEENIPRFTEFLKAIGELSGVKNFPVHVEVRVDKFGKIVPIEVNPLRFGGWCTTADMTYFTYGFNPYEYFFEAKKPDWEKILEKKEGFLYSVIVLDNSSGIDGRKIEEFDYAKLRSTFETVLEMRDVNFKEYPLFGFVFTETREENIEELEYILKSDLSEFVVKKL